MSVCILKQQKLTVFFFSHLFAHKQSARLKKGPGIVGAVAGGSGGGGSDSFSGLSTSCHVPATCPSSAR